MQEILEMVREIRKAQLEALEWRRRYVRKVRILSIAVTALVVAYFVWMFRVVR